MLAYTWLFSLWWAPLGIASPLAPLGFHDMCRINLNLTITVTNTYTHTHKSKIGWIILKASPQQFCRHSALLTFLCLWWWCLSCDGELERPLEWAKVLLCVFSLERSFFCCKNQRTVRWTTRRNPGTNFSCLQKYLFWSPGIITPRAEPITFF